MHLVGFIIRIRIGQKGQTSLYYGKGKAPRDGSHHIHLKLLRFFLHRIFLYLPVVSQPLCSLGAMVT
jgi:hypothetical protein